MTTTPGTGKAPKADPIVITAPKGGDRTVAPCQTATQCGRISGTIR